MTRVLKAPGANLGPLLFAERYRHCRAAGAVETAAAVEINKGGLRQLLFDDFHKLLGKAVAKTAPAFPHLPQRL